MRKVFNDKFLQDHFQKNGYVKIQLLDTAQIEVLTQLYLDLTQDSSPNGFFTTIGENPTIKKTIHWHFSQHFSNVWSTILFDYKSVFSNFITKKTADSKIPYHQDWSLVDESTGKCSLNVWCPLVKTFHENGNLAVIPGFQNLTYQLRSSNHPYSPYIPYQDYLKELELELPTAAGEAIIYDSALLHGSTPNMSGTNRLTASMLVIPKEEQIVIHHFSEDKKIINLYKVNDDYLLNYNLLGDIPPEQFLYKQIPFEPLANPLEELKQLDPRPKNAVIVSKEKKGLLKKLVHLFK